MNETRMNLDRLPPDEVLKGFISAWRQRHWKDMVKFAQKSWVYLMENNGSDPAEQMKSAFMYRPVDIEVLDAELKNNVVFAAKLKIKFLIARGVEKETEVEVRLISEKEPMVPAPNGDWGVVPATIMVS